VTDGDEVSTNKQADTATFNLGVQSLHIKECSMQITSVQTIDSVNREKLRIFLSN